MYYSYSNLSLSDATLPQDVLPTLPVGIVREEYTSAIVYKLLLAGVDSIVGFKRLETFLSR